jgi:hypothetical protein
MSKEKNNLFNGLTFNKIVLPSDEDIQRYYKKKYGEQIKKTEKIENIIENENKDYIYRWDPIRIRYNNNENVNKNKIFGINYGLNNTDDDNNYALNNVNENYKYALNNYNKQEKKSGFAEAEMILSHLDNDYIDLNIDNNEKKEYILATERPDSEFNKFHNLINNKNSYVSYDPFSSNKTEIIKFDNRKLNFNHPIEFNNNNSIININEKRINGINTNNSANNLDNDSEIKNNEFKSIIISNKSNKLSFPFNNTYLNNKDNIEELQFKEKEIKSNSNSPLNTRKIQIINDNNNNVDENNNNSNILNKECKLIYSGECNNIPELKSPIVTKLSSLITNFSLLFNNNSKNIDLNQNIFIDFEIILDIIKKYLSSIDDIENKMILPSDEDIFLQINGKIYSKLTNVSIELKNIEKKSDENNNSYYYIHYSFKLRQYPLLLPEENIDNMYNIKPTMKELLDSNNKYDLKKIENFEISNKFGKIIFLDPIDLSGKAVINDIIKISDGDIDLSNSRVDKLKAKVFLNFDFGEKLEGKFLENIKEFLRHKNSNFVKYENKVLEYNANF